MATNSLLILNGPGLDRLGEIERERYGSERLADIHRQCDEACDALGFAADFRQSNDTGDILQWVVTARDAHDGIIINPAIGTRSDLQRQDAYLAIMHALRHVKLPTIEVHLSNLFAENAEPRIAYDSKVSLGLIAGFGGSGYVMAIKGLVAHLRGKK
jgi:3-dehydroquinate dehydratase-2